MKKMLCLLAAVLVTIISSYAAKVPTNTANEINISKSPQASITIQPAAASNYFIPATTVKDLQKSLGRKLSLKEKISWELLKTQFKQDGPPEALIRKANTHAVLGFAFSLAGLIIFPLFLIPGLLFSQSALRAEAVDPEILTRTNYRLAKAGKIISYIGLGLLLLGIVIIIAILAAWG
jgi:hypothetical protein